ncbi:MAG: amino acid racemase [Oscillospiraceae bacterium]|nr:amino acid racemase [Oscillospiraceae bacterium]
MKKAGIIGGLGPASTIDYYNGIINFWISKHGADCYPEIVIDSLNMNKVVSCVENTQYNELADIIIDSTEHLKNAGADFAAIASNTPHIAWDKFADKTCIPVISIIDAVCSYVTEKKYNKVLIFATAFTMKNGLYDKALNSRGIPCITPSGEDIDSLGSIIYPNLENGIVIKDDKQKMIQIAQKYIDRYSCDALLLGCTEIPLMIKPGDVTVPLINSTQIHIDRICAELEA